MSPAKKAAGAGGLAPAYLVKGDDPSLVRQTVTDLVHRAAGDDALAVEDLGADADVAAAVDAAQTPPFLGDRRVVVVRDVGRFRADELAPLLAYLEAPLPTTVLVLVAGGGTTSTKVTNAVKKVGEVLDASAPTGRARSGWLAERLRAADVRLDPAAADRLADHLGEDVGRLAGVLDTLAAAYGPGARVGQDELEPFLGDAGGVAPWDLTDAIDRGDTAAALTQLRRMLEAGDRHPLVVMATLQRHYLAMLRLDGADVAGEADAAALLGMSPYPAKKVLTQSRRLGSEAVARAVLLLADADLDLRGARGWPEPLVLEVLVARLSRLVPRARVARR